MSQFSKKWSIPLREYEFTDYDYIKHYCNPTFFFLRKEGLTLQYIYISNQNIQLNNLNFYYDNRDIIKSLPNDRCLYKFA